MDHLLENNGNNGEWTTYEKKSDVAQGKKIRLNKLTGPFYAVHNLFSAFRMNDLIENDGDWTIYDKKSDTQSVDERSFDRRVLANYRIWSITLAKTQKSLNPIFQLSRNINAHPIPGLGS